MKWTEIGVKIEQALEEEVVSRLYMLDIKGLSIDDPRQVESLDQRPEDWDYIDEEIIKKKMDSLEDDRITIKVYFSEEERPAEKIEEVKKILKDIRYSKQAIEVTSLEVEEKDWSENWKQFYKTTRIGERVVIKPSWEEYEEKPSDLVIEIDPGMAFGTGTHETTSMCTEALEKHIRPGDRVYDIGTGSGILGIVAGKLGASQVLGVDFDPMAVKVAKENVKNNGLEDMVIIEEGDLFKTVSEKRELIVANIMAEIIAGMVFDVKKYLKDDGIFISSGIILEKISLVENKLIEAGFKILEVKQENSWACIVARL